MSHMFALDEELGHACDSDGGEQHDTDGEELEVTKSRASPEVIAETNEIDAALAEVSLLSIRTSEEETLSKRPSVVIPISNYASADTIEGSYQNLAAQANDTALLRPPSMRSIGLKDFDLLSVIGKGAYGKVFLVKKKGLTNPNQQNNIYAMKVLRKAHLTLHDKDTEHTQNERSVLEALRHPFIVKLYYAFQTSSKLYLILSYAPGGELFTYLNREKMFSEEVACFYSAELLIALQHLHSLGIIYRDLKPENVLLDKDGHVVLTDFGLSKIALDARTVCGTLEFMAPEIVSEQQYDKTVDFWSLGILIFDMLTGSPPFTGNNRKKVMEAITKKKLVCPKYMTPFAKDLCIRLLRKNPKQRIGSGPSGAKEIMDHSFYRKIDWKKLSARECTPAIQPQLVKPEDVSNFAKDFTSLPVQDTPPQSELSLNTGFFKGFSFVNEDHSL